MRPLLFVVSVCFSLSVFSQKPIEEKDPGIVCGGKPTAPGDSIPDLILITPEKMPVFPGGEKALLKFLVANIYWPKGCEDRYGVIAVRFVIDTLGNCRDWEILKTPGKCFEPVVAGIFAKMPCWTPGEWLGSKVQMRLTMPIRIRSE